MTQGEMIRNLRISKNMTQKALAKKLGVSETYISKYERDIRTPKLDTLKRIADALEVDILTLADFDAASGILSDEMNRGIAVYGPYYADLMLAFTGMNEEGQREAVKRLQELAALPKYHDDELEADIHAQNE